MSSALAISNSSFYPANKFLGLETYAACPLPHAVCPWIDNNLELAKSHLQTAWSITSTKMNEVFQTETVQNIKQLALNTLNSTNNFLETNTGIHLTSSLIYAVGSYFNVKTIIDMIIDNLPHPITILFNTASFKSELKNDLIALKIKEVASKTFTALMIGVGSYFTLAGLIRVGEEGALLTIKYTISKTLINQLFPIMKSKYFYIPALALSGVGLAAHIAYTSLCENQSA